MKRLAFSFFFVLFAAAAVAQVSYGVRVGALHSTVSPLGDYSFKHLFGPTAGVMAKYNVNEMLDIEAGLNYAMRGYKDNVYDTDTHFSVEKVHSSYLELPLTGKFYPVKKLGLNIQAGLQGGVLLGRSASLPVDGITQDVLIGNPRRFDCGAHLGIGVDNGRWTVDLRYYLGFVKTYTNWIAPYKNRGLGLTVGYYL